MVRVPQATKILCSVLMSWISRDDTPQATSLHHWRFGNSSTVSRCFFAKDLNLSISRHLRFHTAQWPLSTVIADETLIEEAHF